MDKKMLSIRATEEEHKILARYARQQGRTMSDVLRELIRGLAAQPTKNVHDVAQHLHHHRRRRPRHAGRLFNRPARHPPLGFEAKP